MNTSIKSITSEVIEELILFQEKNNNFNLTQFESLVSAHQYQILYNFINTTVPPKSRILDWGCGEGHFSYFLYRRGYKTTGYSFSEFALRKHLNENFTFKLASNNDPIALPFKNDEFDVVTSIGVLEHVRETGGG